MHSSVKRGAFAPPFSLIKYSGLIFVSYVFRPEHVAIRLQKLCVYEDRKTVPHPSRGG